MSTDSNASRIEMIESELSAYRERGDNSTYALEFRGESINLEVIAVKPQYLLLNHNNSRLSAQLQDHPGKKSVAENPTSPEAQEVIKSLLASTEKFSDLKEQLINQGQQQPGLVTRDGLLINGNTRAAALMAANIPAIKVAVLPKNVTSLDLLDIEMSLQMRRLIHQNYSFTNELLFMKRYLDAGHGDDQLAKQMGWFRRGKQRVQQHMRYLQIIEEVRGLSVDQTLPYSIFDAKKQHLKDLDDEYEKLKSTSAIEDAELMKWTRLSSILLGINKDQVRAMEPEFIEERLSRRLADDSTLKGFIDKYVSGGDDDLGDLLGETDVTFDMKQFLKDFLAHDESRQENGEVSDALPDIYARLKGEIRAEADQIISENKLEDAKGEPQLALREVRERVGSVRAQLPDVTHLSGFKNGDFKYELDKLKADVAKLELEFQRLRNQ